MSPILHEGKFEVGEAGEVSSLLLMPERPEALLVLGHGAGAGMRHPFMTALAERLAGRGVASFRYQFRYMEQGRRSPDRGPRLLETVRAAVATAKEVASGLAFFAGGKSLGGRMTSLAASERPLSGVRGIVFYGFPLHAPGRAGRERANHLFKVELPMLFLQGTRDRLADLGLLAPICEQLGPRARLHVMEGCDHSFGVLKRSGRTSEEMLDELAEVTADWIRSRLAGV